MGFLGFLVVGFEYGFKVSVSGVWVGGLERLALCRVSRCSEALRGGRAQPAFWEASPGLLPLPQDLAACPYSTGK